MQLKMPLANEWSSAIVTQNHETPRSYLVTTEDGITYRRNRKHLLTRNTPPIVPNIDNTPEEPIVNTPDTQNITSGDFAILSPEKPRRAVRRGFSGDKMVLR